MLKNGDPLSILRTRVRAELAGAFAARDATRFSQSPGRLDVMGGVAGSAGAIMLACPIDRSAAVALQARDDRELQIFSFNQFDAHEPFTLRIPLEAVARSAVEKLGKELAAPGRAWAAAIVGCLRQLHDAALIDLLKPSSPGLNVAVLSDIPRGAGLGSAAAMSVATLLNLADHFGLREQLSLDQVATLSRGSPWQFAGNSQAADESVACLTGSAGTLSRFDPQSRTLGSPLTLPAGVRVFGIDSGVAQPPTRDELRQATFMGHKIILEKMREMGRAASRVLTSDPLGGYLANLDPDDYKTLFRPYLPDTLKGGEFLLKYGNPVPLEIKILPDVRYPVRSSVDHHVLEAMRIRSFLRFMQEAATRLPDDPARDLLLNKAGHLMYASDFSYSHDAGLGCSECSLLVKLIREREHSGFYGARITDQGGGGTIAILTEESARSNDGLLEVMRLYEEKTGKSAHILHPASQGAWEIPTSLE
jgi:galactokinase